MTAYFISATGSNSNDGLSLETAWQSWNKIESIPTGAHTVLITGDISGTGLGRVQSNRQLTISASPGTIPTITPAAGSYGTYLNDDLSELIFADPFIWDSTNTTGQAIGISTRSANGNTLVIPDGFHFTNCSQLDRCIWVRDASGTCTHNISIGAVTVEAGQLPKRFIDVDDIRDSSLVVDGVDVGDQTGLSGAERSIFYMSGTSTAGATLEIKNLRGNVQSSGDTVRGVWVFGADNALIEGCDLTLGQTGVAGKVFAYIIDGTAGGANGIIRNNKALFMSPRGYGCRIGNETNGSTATHNGSIFNNEIIGSEDGESNLHGLMLGQCDNGYIGYNKITYALIGAISKGGDSNVIVGNDVDYILEGASAGQYLRVKSSTNTRVSGNTVTVRPGYENLVIQNNEDGATDSTDSIFDGNFINILAGVDMVASGNVIVDSGAAGQTGTFTGNNYYFAGAALPDDMFIYGTTTYTDLDAWNAAAHASHELSQKLTAVPQGGGGGRSRRIVGRITG